jgi:hypothetical protein
MLDFSTVKAPTTTEARERLATAYALDRLWRETMGLPDGDSKEGPLRLVAQLLEREGVPYALIGGVAVQLHTEEPRTTLDIDLAVPTYADVPGQALLAAGFEHTGRHDHSDTWRAPGSGPPTQRTAVQFSAEGEGIADAVGHASVVHLAGGVALRVAGVAELIVLKLAAAVEPARRPSKRAHDVADVLALLEAHPELGSAEMVARVQDVRRRLTSAGPDVTAPWGSDAT